MSTSILGWFWVMNDLDNESEQFREGLLREFQDELIKSMKGNGPFHFEIKWEIDTRTSNDTIDKFAREENNKNGYHTHML